MWKMFSENNNTVYYDKIDKLVNDYNSRRHYSIKMTPNEASKPKNEKLVYRNLYRDLIYSKPKNPNLLQVIRFEFQNTNDQFFIRDLKKIGQKRYLKFLKYCTQIQ